uniref:Predicted protein n=1 Tax=Hordeum vulgare subsp. vulgare TaxID=112509 RepID=F2EBQ9_HORVV|nr:predicted protein [Hordeum vulgare subsp. vulgare]
MSKVHYLALSKACRFKLDKASTCLRLWWPCEYMGSAEIKILSVCCDVFSSFTCNWAPLPLLLKDHTTDSYRNITF